MKKILVALVCAMASLSAQAAPKLGAADLSDCKIEYPRASLMNEEAGVVVLDIVVGADGKVSEGKVATPSGHRTLDSNTLSQVKKCKVTRGAGPYSIEFKWSLS